MTVIDFLEKKEKKEKKDLNDLNGLLRRANRLIQTDSVLSSEQPIIRVRSKDQFVRRLEKNISKEIMEKKMVSRGLFLCGIYVPKVIAQYLSVSPKSWIASDYLRVDGHIKQSILLQRGADVCFLICCLFSERGNWRLMNLKYYRKIGASFYYRFYQGTDKEIGYHMSGNFDQIVKLANRSVKSL